MEHFNVSKLARIRKKLSKKILIIGGKAWSIINFRGSLIKKLVEKGYEVTAVSSEATKSELEKIKNIGASYIDIQLKSNTISILKDIVYFLKLKRIIFKLNPNIIISYTMKPIVYSGLAIFFKKNINFFPLITGLGNIFNTKKINLYPIKIILILLCKIALRNAKILIFQNNDNLQYFKKLKIAPKTKKIIIEGSGVDIDYFNIEPFTNKNITFLLIARLLKDKGIIEYIKAAKKIKSKIKNINFNLIGPKDASNNRVDFDYIKKNHNAKIINYLGFQKNVKPFIADSHVYVLPSYHEGLPRSVLEAMAMGRPIITTRVSGCKETVINNKNGFLIPCKNINILIEKMMWFITNKKKILIMGQKSRNLVEEKFSSKKIDNEFIKLLSD
jgi:glycosyltransferase involved in cell wall biosynthesis